MPSGTRINFAEIPEQKEFDVLPQGTYVARIANLTERQASENSNNPGARILRWEFEVVSNEDYEGRKVWDNQICIESAMWKVKALLNALDIDTGTLSFDPEENEFYYQDSSGEEQQLDMDELVGNVIELKVGIRPARKDPNTGRDYAKQNRVNAFYPHEASDAELLA